MKPLIKATARRFSRRLGNGTTAPILMECEDGREYAVKLPIPGGGTQLLVNELLASILIQEYGLPSVQPALVDVPFVFDGERALLPDDVTRISDGRAVFGTIPCAASVYESGTQEFTGGMEPPATLENVQNPETVLGAVVFDTWVFNEDARQYLARLTPNGRWDLLLFDNEGAFNRNDWRLHQRCRASTKSDALNTQLEALVKRNGVTSFEDHVGHLERSMDCETLREAADRLPRAWLDPSRLDQRRPYALEGLINALDLRRAQVRSIFEQRLL